MSAGASAAAIASYNQLVLAHLRRFKQYPPEAKRGKQGVGRVNFTLGRNGQVHASRLGGSSGVSVLDAETLAMLRRAQPFPAFPPRSASVEPFNVPVEFNPAFRRLGIMKQVRSIDAFTIATVTARSSTVAEGA